MLFSGLWLNLLSKIGCKISLKKKTPVHYISNLGHAGQSPVFGCCEHSLITRFSTAYIIPMLLNPQSRKRNLLRCKIALATVSLECERARYDLHIPGRLALRAQSRELL